MIYSYSLTLVRLLCSGQLSLHLLSEKSNANIEVPNYGVIDWMNVHASGAVFASDMGSQFLIASEANVIPIAIPPAIADYYVSDLGARLQGLKAIFGDSIQASAAALLQYNVSYIISTYSQPSDSITGSPYVTPVYPVQPCFSGGGTRYDFEATGVPQIFYLYSGNTTNYYLLSNLGRELSLTITYLFNPRTSGLVEIYVNNTLVKTLTGISVSFLTEYDSARDNISREQDRPSRFHARLTVGPSNPGKSSS